MQPIQFNSPIHFNSIQGISLDVIFYLVVFAIIFSLAGIFVDNIIFATTFLGRCFYGLAYFLAGTFFGRHLFLLTAQLANIFCDDIFLVHIFFGSNFLAGIFFGRYLFLSAYFLRAVPFVQLVGK